MATDNEVINLAMTHIGFPFSLAYKTTRNKHYQNFNIPESIGFLDSQNVEAWSRILPRLPGGYAPCNAIISEKIMPVNLSVRKLLVQKFIPGVDAEQVLTSRNNEHCLIRPYLGRRRHRRRESQSSTDTPRRRLQVFSLRNFPLHVDQMEEVQINPSFYAEAMADALAFLHWVAKVDGNDVEFVLAEPRSQPTAKTTSSSKSDVLGPHAMWVLDFDCFKDLTFDENGIGQACRCFWRNDPFYPRPGSSNTTDQWLWKIFEQRFLEATLEDQLEREAIGISVEDSLKRMLSIKSVISTTSSFAQRQQAAIGTNSMFREIGTGSVGKVFEHPGTIFAYKLPVTDQHEKMWNNYVMHKRIEASFQSLPSFDGRVEIPRCFWYATPTTNAFWDKHIDSFPDSREFPRKPRYALCMERIFPLPRPIRYALIDKYCPPHGQAQMKTDEANKDCMIRPCFGRVKYGAGV
ncbi:hypothetical protein PT974_01708 [Cladobotryum mycophilum]|uniref:DUF3669 domain-containing protein n=1 Tax=Cladobotryum mycophilum TaxID=491253 RepID=A0ABR0SW71_9HYPO